MKTLIILRERPHTTLPTPGELCPNCLTDRATPLLLLLPLELRQLNYRFAFYYSVEDDGWELTFSKQKVEGDGGEVCTRYHHAGTRASHSIAKKSDY
jgi:hypothetical protein